MQNEIKRIIDEKGLKTIFVIKRVGMSTSSFYEIMNGKAVLSLRNARKIADVLETPLDEIFPKEQLN